MSVTKSFFITTPLGYSVAVTEFLSNTVDSVIIILSATGVLQKFYSKLANFLKKHNYAVYTFDYSGIGDSKITPLTKFDTTLSNWATNDIESVFNYVSKQHPTKKINCIGHSLGGQLLGLVPSIKKVNKILLIASQTNHYSYWSGFQKLKVFINWFIIFPTFTIFFPYFPSKSFVKMENLPKGVAKEFSFWSRQKEYYFSLKVHTKKQHHLFANKLTAFSCEEDNFAPQKSVDWLMNKFVNAKTKRKHLLSKDYYTKEIGHFGFFREKFKDTIWQEFLNDLKD